MRTFHDRRLPVFAAAAFAGICLADPAHADNIVSDGSFNETAAEQLPTGWSGSPGVGVDETAVFSGKASLKVPIPAAASVTAVSATFPWAGPSRLAVLELRYRSEGFGQTMAFEGVNASMVVEWLDAENRILVREQASFPYGATDWTVLCRTMSVPEGAQGARMRFAGRANEDAADSAFWIDDLSLRPVAVPEGPGRLVQAYNVVRDGIYPRRTALRAVMDDDAEQGRAIAPNPAYHAALYPIDARCRKPLPAGLYRLAYRMKTGTGPQDAVAAALDVRQASGSITPLAVRQVRAADFEQPDAYRDVHLLFVHPGGADGGLQFRAHWPGQIPMWFDTVRLEALDVSEALEETASDAVFSWDEPPSQYVEADPDRVHGVNAPVIAAPAPVERSAYLEQVRTWFNARRGTYAMWLRQAEPYPNTSVYVSGLMWHAFLYASSGDTAEAENAVRCLNVLHEMVTGERARTDSYFRIRSWEAVEKLYHADRWLQGSEPFGDEERARLIEILAGQAFPLPTDDTWGAHNRMFGRGMVAEILMQLVPAHGQQPGNRRHVDELWAYWYRHGSTDENTCHYNALGMRYLVTWAMARGMLDEMMNNPAVVDMFERHLDQVFPAGSVPHHGDACGWNVSWGHWVYLFELAGRYTRRGEYRLAAQRIFDYGMRHIENLNSWGYTGEHAMESLRMAWLFADESVEPHVPDGRLYVSERPGLRLLSNRERRQGERRRSLDFTGLPMPAKLAMHSDQGREALSVLFDLVPHAGHNPGAPSQLVSLVDRGSVLLMASGYMDRQRYDSNLVFVEDYEGHPLLHAGENIPGDSQIPAFLGETTTVSEAEQMPHASFARIRVADYANYRATLQRDVLLGGQRLLVVRDRFTRTADLRPAEAAQEPLRMYVAPAWNVGRICAAGANWVDTCMGDFVGVRGIWPNQPVYARWKNPRRNLLLYFAEAPGRRLETFDRRCYDATTPLRFMVRQAWRGAVSLQAPVVFTALLIPHDAFGASSGVADGVRMLLDDTDQFAVSLQEGDVLHVAFVQEEERMLQAGILRTDAKAGYIRLESETVVESSAAGGRVFEYGGHDLMQAH